jgi:hypothetical protein
MTRIVPSTVLTVAALALVVPAAQARTSNEGFVSPSVQSTQDANYGTNVSPSVQSTQDANYGTNVSPSVQSTQDADANYVAKVESAGITTGDKPLANPVQLPETLGVGLLHASTVHVPIDRIPTTPVAVPDSSGNGFDWTAAAIGASVSGILMLMLASGAGFRRARACRLSRRNATEEGARSEPSIGRAPSSVRLRPADTGRTLAGCSRASPTAG